MSLTTHIRNRIKRLARGKPFGYNDLGISKDDYVSAAKVLERLQKDGLIKKVSKGVFYKPEKSVFGELRPEYNELLRPYLFENGKRIAYVTGPALYNRLGLTTQMSFRISIASRQKRISINRGALKAVAVKSYAEVTESNYEILGLLDAFKDAKRIPDCSITDAVKRLRAIVGGLQVQQTESLMSYALVYPPRVRALLGAVLQENGYPMPQLERLKKSLNPMTTIKLGLDKTDLASIADWNIV